jgi:Family of unknown function (DUF5947)
MAAPSIAALRRFIPSRESQEHCDTCGVALLPEHLHTFEPSDRRIRCACNFCSSLHADIYRPIPNDIRILPDFRMSDAQWDDLLIPISLAFFSYCTPVGKVVAMYPGPAGVAESLLPLEAWEGIASYNPELAAMRADVEALLVNRVGMAREYFIVPIDECYRLAGMIRLHWHGLSGGALVWGEIAKFLESLRRKDSLPREGVLCPA